MINRKIIVVLGYILWNRLNILGARSAFLCYRMVSFPGTVLNSEHQGPMTRDFQAC
jgi:hypothetical protein